MRSACVHVLSSAVSELDRPFHMTEACSSRLWAGSQHHLCMHPYFILVPLLVCPQEHVRSYIISTPDEHLRDSSSPAIFGFSIC